MPIADTQRAFPHASLDGKNLVKKGLVGLRERSELLHSHGSISGVLAPVGQHAGKVKERTNMRRVVNKLNNNLLLTIHSVQCGRDVHQAIR